jgi:hypothetical protein
MAELDCAELAAMYMALWSMELALIGAIGGGGIKHTSELRFSTIKRPYEAGCRRVVQGDSKQESTIQ